VLKARYPLEFAAATLRFSKDDEQGAKLLRELSKEGYNYTPVDPLNSGMGWTVHEGKLLGGLVNVKGIGLKMAADIIARRRRGDALQPGQQKKLDSAITPFDDIFEGQRRWGDIYKNPTDHNILSQGLTMITDIQEPDDYVFLAKIRDRNPRDLNEHHSLSKRDGRRIDRNNLFLNLTLEDDTGMIICTISRFKYARWGKELVERSRIGEWFIWRGKVRDDGWRKVYIDKWRRLEDG